VPLAAGVASVRDPFDALHGAAGEPEALEVIRVELRRVVGREHQFAADERARLELPEGVALVERRLVLAALEDHQVDLEGWVHHRLVERPEPQALCGEIRQGLGKLLPLLFCRRRLEGIGREAHEPGLLRGEQLAARQGHKGVRGRARLADQCRGLDVALGQPREGVRNLQRGGHPRRLGLELHHHEVGRLPPQPLRELLVEPLHHEHVQAALERDMNRPTRRGSRSRRARQPNRAQRGQKPSCRHANPEHRPLLTSCTLMYTIRVWASQGRRGQEIRGLQRGRLKKNRLARSGCAGHACSRSRGHGPSRAPCRGGPSCPPPRRGTAPESGQAQGPAPTWWALGNAGSQAGRLCHPQRTKGGTGFQPVSHRGQHP
jgi:hypothetical protein